MQMVIKRQIMADGFTLGTFSIDGARVGYTCEDPDRRLEEGGVKIPGETAIPRGKYRAILSFSQRFQALMPEVLEVPGFEGIRIHGGNTAADTHGCPLLGAQATPTGVRECAGVNAFLRQTIGKAIAAGEDVWLEVM